jgi:type II secretory pathway component GspD/PulD (secretin)
VALPQKREVQPGLFQVGWESLNQGGREFGDVYPGTQETLALVESPRPEQQAIFWESQLPSGLSEADRSAAGSSPAVLIPSQWAESHPLVRRASNEAPVEKAGISVAPDTRGSAVPRLKPVPLDAPLPPSRQGEGVVQGRPSSPITMHLDDVEVRKALEMLSRETAANLMVSPGVRGRVTVNLTNVSPEEALNAILRLANLVTRKEKEIFFIYTPEEYAQSNRSLRSFPLDHVAATDVEKAVKSLLSATGNVYLFQSSPADNRKARDIIVVEDGQQQLDRIGQYIAQIDRPARQVLIEAHILEVKLEDTKKCGINWNYLFRVMNDRVDLRLQGMAVNPLSVPTPQGFFVNVRGGDLTALIECLKTTADVKTLASPKLLVMHGQKARIQIGEKLGYKVIMTTETSSMQDVKFLEVGVVLDVTPRISRDDQVALRVKPKVSSGAINAETQVPDEKTTETETDVLMNDGQGMVIGGLIQERDDNKQEKIPWLGDIWLVGGLFQRHERIKTRSEIIITLLPRVVPYPPEYKAIEQTEVNRAETPLFQGPLCPYPRPWEPHLPSAWQAPSSRRHAVAESVLSE